MDNKLSELSKPVAYDYQYAGVETCEGFGSWRNELTWDCPPDWMVETGKVKNLKPRYSQEYVSALLAELEAKDKHIAELEQRLATPVRLPNKNDDEFWFDGVFQVAKFDRAVERAISAAGFKFVGDKQ